MIALLGLLACYTEQGIPLHFEGPTGVTWLQPSADLPFEDEIGLVSNARSGRIYPLDLKEGRLLTDDAMASFLRASPIATGSERQLRDIAAFALEGAITVWALDVQRGLLVQAPYVLGFDENEHPEEVVPSVGSVEFFDEDDSGDSPTLDDVEVRAGFTTTESWSIEFDGARWWAKGSRSGVQEREPKDGTAYLTDDGELGFVINGSATAGDRFELSTDTALKEWTYAGLPTAIAQGSRVLYVAVDGDTPLVGAIDPFSGEWLGSIGLPLDADPWRMALGADGELFVADSASPRVYQIVPTVEGDLTSATLSTLATAAPVLDVAWQSGAGADGTEFEHLFVAPVGLQRVDVYDLVVGAWFDPNPADVAVEGVNLGSPISGLAPSFGTVLLQQTTEWGALPRVPTVVVSTQEGFVFMLDAATGCAVVSERGPHGPNELLEGSSAVTYAALDDVGVASDAALSVDDATGEQITTSNCGGVARGESWSVVYDSAQLAWEVEGSLSGTQANLAREDSRYVSDTGAISFLITSGSAPATDGDRFDFAVDRGLLVWAATDADEDGSLGAGDSTWEAPGRPVSFQVLSGPTGGGWDAPSRKEFVLLPLENSDLVARLHLDSGKSEVLWQ